MKSLQLAGKHVGLLSFAYYLRRYGKVLMVLGALILLLVFWSVVGEARRLREARNQVLQAQQEVARLSEVVKQIKQRSGYPLPLLEEVPFIVRQITAGLFVVVVSVKEESNILEGESFNSMLYSITVDNSPYEVLEVLRRVGNPWVALEKINYSNGRTQIEVRVYYRVD